MRRFLITTAIVIVLAASAFAYLAYEFGDPPGGYYTPTSDWSVLGAGDVDADGCDDLVLTMRFDPITQDDVQTTWVMSGGTGAPIYGFRIDASLYDADISPDFSAYTPGKYEVHALGDVDGDRHADLALTFPGTLDGKNARSVVISGRDASLLLANLPTTRRDRATPPSVRALDDVDRDGRVDLLVSFEGNPLLGVPGRIVLVSGRDGHEIQRVQETPRSAPLENDPHAIERTEFGHSVCVASDVDGDSVADFVVGAPVKESITCYSGANGRELWTRAGYGSTRAIGDVDGDGVSDLVATASNRPDDAVSGRDGSTLFEAGGLRFCRPLGDVDGDGFTDVIGFPAREGVLAKRVVVASGKSFRALLSLPVDNTVLGFQRDAGPAGDTNGDGVPDIVVTTNRDLVAEGRRQRWSPGFGVVTIRSGKDGSVLRTYDRDFLQRAATRELPRVVIR